MRYLGLFVAFFLLAVSVKAQDPQFSQFYASRQFLNPAYVGGSLQGSAGIAYRNQWPSIEATFVTMVAFLDYYLEDYNSGVGLILSHDRQGIAGIRSTEVGLQYAYQLYVTDWLTFRPGFQVSFNNGYVNFSDLVFPDQIDPITGIVTGAPSENLGAGLSRNYIDLSAGGLLFTANSWLGGSVHHLNTPNYALVGSGVQQDLAMRFSIHGGHRINLGSGVIGQGLFSRPQERSLTPTFQYKRQDVFEQLDLGLYLTLEPIIFGTWYRGLPYKQVEGIPNNDALIFLLGFVKKGKDDQLNIGYSYDVTISKLGTSSGGAHEFTLVYTWPVGNPRKPPKNVRLIPCPDF
ncbi:MAG: PorP/SprF family type IX secretion system membrane protein [Candidatus Cyclobacteriaceae bacterium M2_1C_046]